MGQLAPRSRRHPLGDRGVHAPAGRRTGRQRVSRPAHRGPRPRRPSRGSTWAARPSPSGRATGRPAPRSPPPRPPPHGARRAGDPWHPPRRPVPHRAHRAVRARAGGARSRPLRSPGCTSPSSSSTASAAAAAASGSSTSTWRAAGPSCAGSTSPPPRGSTRAVVKTLTANVSDGALLIEGDGRRGRAGPERHRGSATAPAGYVRPRWSAGRPPSLLLPRRTRRPCDRSGAGHHRGGPRDRGAAPSPAESTRASATERTAAPAAPATPALHPAPPVDRRGHGPARGRQRPAFRAEQCVEHPDPGRSRSSIPSSSAMIRSIAPSNRATANLYEYGDPVFTATAGSPTVRVDCTRELGNLRPGEGASAHPEPTPGPPVARTVA